MTTPRKHYPSDHRRWFRVMEDILDDPKLAECTPSECWLFIALLATANRMKSRDGIITVPRRTIISLARVRDWNVARTRLDRVANVGLLGHKQDGACHTITLYKWAESQGFAPAELRRDSVETPCTTPTPTPTPKNPPISPPERVKVKPKPRREKKVPTPFPDDTTSLEAGVRAWVRKNPEHSAVSVPKAIEFVGDWAKSAGKTKVDWLATMRNAIRSGWAVAQSAGPPDQPKHASARRGYHKNFDPDKQAKLIQDDLNALVKQYPVKQFPKKENP